MRLSSVVLLFLCGLVTLATSCITQEDKDNLLGTKTSTYGGLTFLQVPQILSGRVNPLEILDWKNAVFVNWAIKPWKISWLEKYLRLPDDVHIASIPIVKGEEPQHYLSFAIKNIDVPRESAGEEGLQTTQVDWFVYVTVGDDPEPTLMIIESNYDFETTSPLGEIPVSDITFDETEGGFTIAVSDVHTNLNVSIDKSITKSKSLDEAFQTSFDKLYWPNGVYSLLSSNGSLLLSQVQFERRQKAWNILSGETQGWTVNVEKSQWSRFIRFAPESVMYFEKTVELAAEVWVNIEDPDLDLSIRELLFLRLAKKSIYSERAASQTALISSFEWEPIIKFSVTQNAPVYFMNFRIRDDKLQALSNFIPLQEGLELAKVRFRENGPEEYILTLNVYEVDGLGGLVTGFRADWSVFIKEPGSEQPLFMIVEANFSGGSLDPVNGLQLSGAETFEHGVVGANVVTKIQDGTTVLDASFPLPAQCERFEQSETCDMADIALSTANDRIYYSNGIYDLGRWEKNIFGAEPLSLIDPSTVTLNEFDTVWNQFIDPDVYELVVTFETQDYYLTPWANLEETPICS